MSAEAYFCSVSPIPMEEYPRLHGRSWRTGIGCPPIESLVRLVVAHHDFQGGVARGVLEVSKDVAEELGEVFGEVFSLGFPIEKMRPIDLYDGADEASMRDNNSSAFNCRFKTGKQELSVHAFGRALDLNPVQNPYETASGLVLPPNAAAFARRGGHRVDHPGALHSDSGVVRAFEAKGWHWGGRWTEPVDWQHFEKP